MFAKRLHPTSGLILAALFALASLPFTSAATAKVDVSKSIIDVDTKRPNDEREYRTFTLDNKLEVLLVSDPALQKSSAALDVAVGGLEDPMEDEGMAHFLEHLLFLGTEKYPDVEEYNEYLTANGGSSNAYTAGERTNYLFEVNHDAFEGTLDRFAQFFIAPRFNPEFVERERNAVNSEHQKNLQNDFWRMRMIQRALHRDGHPRQRFSTGDLATLEGVDRETLIEFYNKFYSSNVMKLAVMSNRSLDDLEAEVRPLFSQVPNHNRDELSYPSDVWDPAQLPRLIQIKPVADVRTLGLEFATPSVREHWKAKPTSFLGTLLGHEGEGSLLSQLKKENLATGLGSGGHTTSFATYLNYRITLTEEGRQNTDRVIELFFSYVDMLKNEGLKDWFYLENKTMADLGYVYRDHEEGMWTASDYAEQMQYHPALEFEKNRSLFYEYDPELFASYVAQLTPDRMQATLIAPDVMTDTIEPHYESEYSVTKIADDKVKTWKNAKAIKAFHYPDENPFIPDDLSLLENDKNDEPYKLIDGDAGTFWFQQDKSFKIPRGSVDLLFLTDVTNASPRDRLMATLYARAVYEGLNEWNYPALEAGLSASLSAESRGIRLSVSGYSQRIPELLVAFSEKLDEIAIDEKTFAAMKDDYRRELANEDFSMAYSQTFYEAAILLNPEAIHRNEYKDLVDSVTLDEIKEYSERVLEQAAVEGTAYGNFDGKKLKKSIEKALSEVSDGVLPEDRRPSRKRVSLEKGKQMARVFSTKADNSCWMGAVEFGRRDYRREAILRVGAAALESGFYGEMRTKQQLGYIVWSSASLNFELQGMWFMIQSGTHSATDISNRASTYLDATIPTLAEMDPEEFESLKASIVDELAEKDTDIGQRMGSLNYEGIILDGDFDRKERISAEVQKLTVEDVAKAYADAFDATSRAYLAIYLDADGSEPSKPAEELITDPTAFKTKALAF